MSKPSRSDLRLYARALRQGWNISADVRAETINMLREIMTDKESTRRERTSAARAVMQASRVELDAIRIAYGAQFENLSHRLKALEGGEASDGRLAKAASGD